jgi:hypothetical protein
MARYRTYKPELFADEKLIECPPIVRLLFLGLLPFCDDMGRRSYSPRRIKYEVFPGDDDITPKKIDSWLHTLNRAKLISIYEVDEELYIWVPRFLRHQRIDRPGHSDLPPHPNDPEPDCLCPHCKAARNGSTSVPHGTHRAHSSKGHVVPIQRTDSTNAVETEVGKGSSVGSVYSSGSNTNTADWPEFEVIPDQTQQPQTERENRNARRTALDELAGAILDKLHIPSNPKILNTLTRSIQVRARSRGWTLELSGSSILARAAYVAAQAQPENWEDWLYDARYDYVLEGDSKLSDRSVSARQVCGGKRCEDGWEIVKVGDREVARRCPDCVKLWQE